MRQALASLKTEFQRTARRWVKQLQGRPLEVDDLSHIESQSFASGREIPGERETLSYEAHRARTPDRWDVRLVTTVMTSGGHGISVVPMSTPVENGQGLSVREALDLITHLSPPHIRQAKDACNRPAAVADMIGHTLPEGRSPGRGPAL
jgi:hypothetical protein